MTFLLELREKFYRFVGKREKLVSAAVKFAVAFLTFFLINRMVGYMDILDSVRVQAGLELGLAAICAFTPAAVTLLFAALLILFNFYTLSPALCLIALLLFIIIFCLYFRFAGESKYFTILTPLFFAARIPYVMPNALGLVAKPYKVISVLCGTMIYYLMANVRENEALFLSFEEESEDLSLYSLAVSQIFANEEMLAFMIAFIAAAIVVYCIRCMHTDHAWGTSVVVGSAVQLLIVGGAEIMLGNISRLVAVFFGCLVSLVLSAGFMYMVRVLDYSRVERVQFEDDEYYYYVKAIPKAFVEPEDKQVKQISGDERKSRHSSGRGWKVKPVSPHQREEQRSSSGEAAEKGSEIPGENEKRSRTEKKEGSDHSDSGFPENGENPDETAAAGEAGGAARRSAEEKVEEGSRDEHLGSSADEALQVAEKAEKEDGLSNEQKKLAEEAKEVLEELGLEKDSSGKSGSD